RAAFAREAGEGALVPVPRASLDVSDGVITARRVEVERDEAKVLRRIRVFAAEAGSDWYYRYPVKNRRTGQTDYIEGPSIKCANSVARYYGNCQIDTRVIDNGDSWIIYARFVDIETGFSMTRPFQQRKGQKTLNTDDSARQLDIALQIGVSKAIRNVICNALENFTSFAFEEAQKSFVTKVGQNLPHYRQRTLDRLGELAVPVARVEAVVGRPHAEWLAADVARIIAQIQAINDGMATPEETWPPVQDGQHQGSEAAAPPRPSPPRSKSAAARPAPELETEPYEVRDHIGEIALQTDDPQQAAAAYREALAQGKAQRGSQGVLAVADNNSLLMNQLDSRGFGAITRELGFHYAEVREAAHAEEMAKAESAKAAAAPPRSALFDDPVWTVERPKLLDGSVDFERLRDTFLVLVSQCENWSELDKLGADNEDTLMLMRRQAPELRAAVSTAIEDRQREFAIARDGGR
ncbi:MAG TPA: hypothetical protein VFA22_02465, partial [Stellaceae bacterium]|nr:hypothetical protein [Stellaceae bacterium]